MLAIPDEYLLKFHACKDAKSLWEAIKNMFVGLDKTYDRFQKLISQLKIHDEVISQEDANMKLLRSLPSAWNNIALIIRNKSDLDTLSMDDLYNNLKVYESEIKGHSSSSSDSHNDQASTASYADSVMFSFFTNQSNAPQLDNEDLEQINADDLEEMDFKWQVAMLTMRVKRFIKKTRRKLDLNGKETVGFDRTKVKCYNCHRRGHFARECRAPRNQGNRNRDAPRRNAPEDTSTTNALVVQDGIDKTGLGYDGQMNESDLNAIHVNESEVLDNVFNSRDSDGDDNQVNDRFKKGEGYHAVPPPYTGNYMPPRADLSFAGLDDSVFKSKESDIEDENVFKPKEVKKTVKPRFEKIEFVNARNTTAENKSKAKTHRKFSQSPRATVLTKSGQVLVNAAKQSSHRASTSVSVARRVNTAASRPNVNNALLTTYSYFKAHSPVRRPFNQKSAAKTNNFNEKINNARVDNVTTIRPKAVVSAAEEIRDNVVKRDKKNRVLFTDIECVVLSPDFKLLDESKVLLKVPRNNNMYSFDLKNVAPLGAGIENQIDHKVKTIRCDNGTEFKNRIINKFFEMKGIRKEFSVARNPQQNGTGPNWMFDIDTFTMSMNYQPVFAGNQINGNAGPKSSKDEVTDDAGKKSAEAPRKENGVQDPAKEGDKNDQEIDVRDQEEDANGNSTYRMFTHVSAARSSYVNLGGSIPVNVVTLPNVDLPIDPLMPDLEDTTDLKDTEIFSGAYDDEVEGAVADFNNLELTIAVSPIPTTRIHKDHLKEKIIEDLISEPQTRRMTKTSQEHAMHAIGTKWVYRNKKDERGIVVRNKKRLVAQGHTQEEEIDYDEVFAPVAKIEAIRLFLAYTSFMGFIMYQMDVKSAFLYDTIEEEVYVCQPLGFENSQFSDKVYKVEKTLYGLHQAPRACQDKYVADILKKFDFSSVKIASTPIETNNALLKDEEVKDVDVHLYQSMIGSLMYLTASRPNIMFGVCACARKSTTGGCQFLGKRLILWQCKKQTVIANSNNGSRATAKSKTVNDVKQIQATVDGKTMVISKSSVRSDLHFNDEDGITCLSNDIDLAKPFNDVYVTPVHTKKVFTNMKRQNKYFLRKITSLFASMLVPQVVEGEGLGQPFKPQPLSSTAPPSHEEQSSGPPKKVGDEAVYTGEDDRVVRSATTTTSLEAEQESGSGPRCQDTILGDADAQTRFETASKQSPNLPLSEVNTSRSREDSMEHQDDMMDSLPPTPDDSPSQEVTHLEVMRLYKKVKRLEKKQRARTSGMNLFKIGTSKRQSLDKKNVSKHGRNLKTRPIFEECDTDDEFDDINDMVDEAMENVEGETVNAGGAVNTTTTRVSAASASVTTAGVSISTAEPRTPLTTTTTAFEYEDLTINQTLIKMRSEKAKEKRMYFQRCGRIC
nr:hypothetical protein [Tanacetum cinerariifolium]